MTAPPLDPLAVPDTRIGRAQLRVYSYCSGSAPTLLASADLTPLSTAYQTSPGMTLWTPESGGPEGDPGAITMSVPSSSGCAINYVPLGIEVRVAAGLGATAVDLNSLSCAQLAATLYADCWSRLSDIRVYRSGNPEPAPIVGDVSMHGGTCAPDPLFSRTPGCTANVGVAIDWGSRANGPLNVPGNFSVAVQGQALSPPPGGPTGTWTTAAPVTLGGQSGANQLTLQYEWQRTPCIAGRGSSAESAPPTLVASLELSRCIAHS